eukprot:115117_1
MPDVKFKTVKYNSKFIQLIMEDTDLELIQHFPHAKWSIMHRAHGIIMCYDTTNKESLVEGIKYWNDKCAKQVVYKIIVGTKCDLESRKVCNKHDAFEIAKECGIEHVIETSALNGQNVHNVFDIIVENIFDYMENR